jgi:hypothetical protein
MAFVSFGYEEVSITTGSALLMEIMETYLV